MKRHVFNVVLLEICLVVRFKRSTVKTLSIRTMTTQLFISRPLNQTGRFPQFYIHLVFGNGDPVGRVFNGPIVM